VPDDADDGDCQTAGWGALPQALLDPEIDETVFRALSEVGRRRVLYVLLEGGTVTVPELATVLVGWDRVGRRGVATPGDRDQRLTSLRHVDLPLLADAGLVRYDRSADTVALADLSGPVRDVVRWVRTNETGVGRDDAGPDRGEE
jgi:DNA-binding transcriptional ArsR family regulator